MEACVSIRFERLDFPYNNRGIVREAAAGKHYSILTSRIRIILSFCRRPLRYFFGKHFATRDRDISSIFLSGSYSFSYSLNLSHNI